MKISIYIAIAAVAVIAVATWYISKNYHISNIAASTGTSTAAVAAAATPAKA